MTPRETFDMWMRYQQEAQKTNFASVCFTEASLPSLAQLDSPTITIRREDLLRFRAAYLSLQVVVASLLDQQVDEMSVGSVMLAMAERAHAESTPASQQPEKPR